MVIHFLAEKALSNDFDVDDAVQRIPEEITESK